VSGIFDRVPGIFGSFPSIFSQASLEFGQCAIKLGLDDSRSLAIFKSQTEGDASLLRLSKYSPMLNPIENMWSALKARVKTRLRDGVVAFMGPPPDGQTRNEFRMQYMETVALRAMEGVYTFVMQL